MDFSRFCRKALLFASACVVASLSSARADRAVSNQALPATNSDTVIHAETIHAELRKDIFIVPCSIGGISQLRCILCTASKMMGLSPELAKKLHLTPASELNTSINDPRHYLLPPQEVRLGTNTFEVKQVGVAPVGTVSKSLNEHVDALLSTAIFEQSQITTDPVAQEIRIAPPGTPVNLEMHETKIFLPLGVPMTFVALKSTTGKMLPAPMTLNLESEPALLLGKPYWDIHASPQIAAANSKTRNGYNYLTVEGFGFGRMFNNVPAAEQLEPTDILMSNLIAGIVGAPLLNRFVITWDFSKSAVYLSATKDFDKPFAPLP